MHDVPRTGGARHGVLQSPLFLVSLALLLANDLVLKAAYPGWFTGKLSDFAGLIVFSLFLFTRLPCAAGKVAVGVALFFVWWKSQYSGFAIDLFNEYAPFAIGRVIDYSDLLALVVLPFAVVAYESRRGRPAEADLWRRLARLPILVATVFAITGTSYRAVQKPMEISAADAASAPSAAEVDAILDGLLVSRHDRCEDRGDGKRFCMIDDVHFTYSVEAATVKFDFQQRFDQRSMKRLNRVIDSIKVAFAERGRGFTYVEPLFDPNRDR